MQLDKIGTRSSIDRPTLCFLVGLALAMLTLWFPFIPIWQTFIHMWRVEIATSLVLIGVVGYALYRMGRDDVRLAFGTEEWKLIILPIMALIAWSAVSALWAPSWKSAVHHALIWTEYLVLYVVFRHLLEREGSLRALLTMFCLTLTLYALPAIFEYCAYLTFGGLTTLGIRFAKYGEQVVTFVPLVALGIIRTRGRQFAIGLAILTLLWLLLFCSFGRANYYLFAGVMAALFTAVVVSRRYRRYAPRFALICAVLVVAPLPLQIFSLFSTEAPVPILGRMGDTEAIASSNSFRKLMVSVSVEMIRDNPLLGVGADNFGMQVNGYRQAYGAANPSDVNLANAEDLIPSHAHNELLQIATELGAAGVMITAWLVLGIAVIAFRAARQIPSGSLYPIAAVLGLGAFLASSLVSAYSFRVMQNGIVFFFVLAVASKSVFRPVKQPAAPDHGPVLMSGRRLQFACVIALLACIGLTVYSTLRVTSVAITARANNTKFLDQATPLYLLAMRLDDENPDVRQNFGMRLFHRQRYGEAVPYLESAIAIGRAPSAELSYLATAKSLSGDQAGADATMKLASELYPRSPFVLTRYATLLEDRGKNDDASLLFERAMQINGRAAATWRAVITSGPMALSQMAATDKSYMHVMELTPRSSIYAVVTERYIKFPDEQRFSLVKVVKDED